MSIRTSLRRRRRPDRHDPVRVGPQDRARRPAHEPGGRDARGRRPAARAAEAHARPAADRDRGPRAGQGPRRRRALPGPQAAVRDRRPAARAGDRGLAVDEHRRVGADADRRRRAPTGALLFTKPLGPEQLKEAMEPSALEALAAHSPLGVPSVLGVLFRVAEAAERRVRVPPVRPAAAADRPRGAADDAPLAADRPACRPDDRRVQRAVDARSRRRASRLDAEWSTIPAPARPAAAAAS